MSTTHLLCSRISHTFSRIASTCRVAHNADSISICSHVALHVILYARSLIPYSIATLIPLLQYCIAFHSIIARSEEHSSSPEATAFDKTETLPVIKLNMQTSLLQELVVGTPIISATYNQLQKSVNRYLPDPSTQGQYLTTSSTKEVRLGTNISETFKRKLRLGARILQMGGVDKVFKQFFNVKEGERLLKATQCYLSTTSGPLAGFLFISTDKVSFCSERSMKVYTQKGHMLRIRYKVVIPLKNIKCVNKSENVKKPTQKYIEIVTEDNFDFWFMGVFKYQKTFKYLEQAVSQA
ncbi:hypothetical protein RJT34_25704 [Clitoria ternatea]|uniref:GRAM domain-containing protein n=1 Tax=Clitoria ternatea TaxID=43366 RepID=A0AAN9FSQ1_CLITE